MRSPLGIIATLVLCVSCGDATHPTKPSGAALVIVTVGDSHSCGLSTTGVAYCWGSGGLGAVGDSSSMNRLAPVRVAGGLTFVDLDTRHNHTCGLVTGGAAYCWGFAPEGGLGAPVAGASAPVAVIGGLSFLQSTAGGGHSCGITAAGEAYCWGRGDHGQLGSGTYVMGDTAPVPVAGFAFTSITAGGSHTCALITGGDAYCWGSNSNGQLGIGNTDLADSVPTKVSGTQAFRQLSAGLFHTCGVTADSVAYCWGSNVTGQLGNGSHEDRYAPVAVGGGLRFKFITAGGSHTCAISTSDEGYCWGTGDLGELGTGTRLIGDSLPRRVAGGLRFGTISAGFTHTCATTLENTAYCWGRGGSGQLGSSPPEICTYSTPCSLSPRPVDELP